jgi:hypothetical protein
MDQGYASCRTLSASKRAILTLLMRVPLTFIGTCQTNLGAKTTDLLGHLTVASHGRRCKTADRCAVSIKHDAASHHLQITFFETSSQA